MTNRTSAPRLDLHAVACAMALLLVAGPAAAQQPDTARLKTIVVTATRADVALPASSLSATVLSGDELRARGVTHLADALRTVPGAALVRSGSWGGVTSLFLRGGESDYVKVLIDGVPMNAAGGGIDLSTITLDHVDRIEIVRGPGSVLYGSDAVTGVVHIFTRDGSGAARAGLAAAGGSHGWREGSAEVSAGTSLVSGSLSAARHSTDGIHAFNSSYRNDNLDATVRLRPWTGTELRLDARHTDAEVHYPTDGQGQPVDSNQVRTERRRLVGLDARHIFGARTEGRLELSHSDVDAVSDNQPDSDGDTGGFYSRTESDAARLRADARLNLHLHERALVTVGAEWSRQRERSRGSSTFGTTPLPDTRFDASRINRALYAQLLSGGSERISATVGARIDRNDRFGTFVTGRAAAAVNLAGTTLRAALGNAFREPAFSEHFTTDFSVGNPDLDPERTVSWEVGVARSVAGDRVALSATWFDQRFRDMIQYVFQDQPGAPNYVNVAEARAAGLELEARFAAAGILAATASYSFVRTEVQDAGFGDFGAFEEGKPLLRRPRHSASLLNRWSLGARGSFTSTVSYVGRRDDVDFGTFPGTRRVLAGYALLDLGLELPVLIDAGALSGLTITARVENALDREYQPAYGFRAPGRAVVVGARAAFGR